MDLSKLTAEERAALKAQLDAEEKVERNRIEQERETYKQLVDATVKACVTKLQKLSPEMMASLAIHSPHNILQSAGTCSPVFINTRSPAFNCVFSIGKIFLAI